MVAMPSSGLSSGGSARAGCGRMLGKTTGRTMTSKPAILFHLQVVAGRYLQLGDLQLIRRGEFPRHALELEGGLGFDFLERVVDRLGARLDRFLRRFRHLWATVQL